MNESTADAQAATLARIEAFRQRRPRLRDTVVTMAHGAGGKASAALVESVFVPAFSTSSGPLTDGAVLSADGAVLSADGGRIVMTTDSFVVSPWRFPGGSIGHLAVHGTVNDLAVMGATPKWLSAAFVIEEGLSVEKLQSVVADMAAAAAAADVTIVTGDTKVVGRGAADGLYITTAGIGLLAPTVTLDASLVRPGDKVLLSGSMGDHGMAVMLARGDLDMEADIESDTASIAPLVAALLEAAPNTRWMRDPTRGGVATVCNELARDAGVSVVLDEVTLPVRPQVAGACDLLGIDPLYVANEGKVLAVVAAAEAADGLDALRSLPGGAGATLIGEVLDGPKGIVVLRTAFGGTRIVDMLVGDPLPRIC